MNPLKKLFSKKFKDDNIKELVKKTENVEIALTKMSKAFSKAKKNLKTLTPLEKNLKDLFDETQKTETINQINTLDIKALNSLINAIKPINNIISTLENEIKTINNQLNDSSITIDINKFIENNFKILHEIQQFITSITNPSTSSTFSKKILNATKNKTNS